MELKHILSFATIGLFLIIQLSSKSLRRTYIKLVLVLLPFIDLNLTPERFGTISVFDFMSYFILIVALNDFFRISESSNIYKYSFVVLSGILLIGSATSDFIISSFVEYLKLLSIFIYSKILIDECAKDSSFSKVVINYLKLSCAISLVFLATQLIIGPTFTFYPDLNPNVSIVSDTIRYPSFFQDPQKYAQFLSMGCFTFLLSFERKNKLLLLNILFIALAILGILLTGARSAFFGMCLGLGIVIACTNFKTFFSVTLLCTSAYFILTGYSEHFSFFNRTDDYSSSIEIRNEIWNEGLQIFFAHPLLGIGVGNHHNYVLSNVIDGYYLIDHEIVYYGTESGYLQYLIEFGLLGFLLLSLFILFPVIEAIRAFRRVHDLNIIIIIASVASWSIAFTTVNSLSDKRILVVLATLICLLIVSKNFYKNLND